MKITEALLFFKNRVVELELDLANRDKQNRCYRLVEHSLQLNRDLYDIMLKNYNLLN
jgi:hypothetical protein